MKDLADWIARAAATVPIGLAIQFGLALAAVALSFTAILWARALFRCAVEAAKADRDQALESVASLRREVDALAAQLQDLRNHTTQVSAAVSRPGLNLTKRSQALRMHRRGESPAEIASALGLPLQEVDLLLKVHRIVISHI